MLVKKTIKGRIENPTNFKRECLDWEYRGLQWFMIFGVDKGIYSHYKYPKKWNQKELNYKEYPITIHSVFTKLVKSKNKLADYWVNFSSKRSYKKKVWLPIKLYNKIPEGWRLRDSFIVYNSQKDWYEVRLNFEKEVEIKKSYSHILAVDLGEKVMATVCGSWEKRPRFYGREIRGIRRHFAWLRKRLGERKLLKKIKSISKKEKLQVETLLHSISKEIVQMAHKHDALIVLGDLKGIRNGAKGKGKRFNRIISNFPHYKMSQYITYKANEMGIAVVFLNERYTSKTCSKCGSLGNRVNQGLFKCPNCKYQANADWNGVENIRIKFKRDLGYMPLSVGVASPLTHL